MIDGVERGGYLLGRMIAVAWWSWVADPGISTPGLGVRAEQHVLHWHGWMGVWSGPPMSSTPTGKVLPT